MAIQANELRIENYVKDHLGRIQKVAETRSDSYICYLSNGIKLKYKLNTTQPIPLTEEWLLKFGFLDITGVDYILNIDVDFKLLLIPADGFYPQIDKADDNGWQSVSLNKIEYVHQLQNLYFALCGEELKLN